MGVAQQGLRLTTVVQVDHRRLRVGVGVWPQHTAQRRGADALDLWPTDDAPVVVDVVTDQILNLGRQRELGMVRTIRQLLIKDVAGGKGAELNRLARFVAL
ncbi:hypothetical protein D3C77_316230 [compost metagenome]